MSWESCVFLELSDKDGEEGGEERQEVEGWKAKARKYGLHNVD